MKSTSQFKHNRDVTPYWQIKLWIWPTFANEIHLLLSQGLIYLFAENDKLAVLCKMIYIFYL